MKYKEEHYSAQSEECIPTVKYKDRLIKLIYDDMENNDVTALLINGFKGLSNMTIDELEESFCERFEVDEDGMYRLLVEKIIKGE